MRVSIAEYAFRRGCSAGTIKWLATSPKERPSLADYPLVKGLAEVLTSPRRYASLLGCSCASVAYKLQRGVLVLSKDGKLGVHDSDLRWGLHAYDARVAALDPLALDDNDNAVEATIHYQMLERELIRLGCLKPDGLIEAQLGCVARSPEWWRRNQGRNRFDGE